jgi:hypothetical protein
MFDNYEIDNILHAGLVFIVYLFIVIILYFVLSYPLDLIFDSLSAASVGTAAQNPMSWQLPGIRWGLNVAFALGFAYPVTWFAFWVFSKEPDFSMFRRQ